MATANDFAVEYKKQLDQILSNLGPRANVPPAPVPALRFPTATAGANLGAPAYPEPARPVPGEAVSTDVETPAAVDEIPPEQRTIEDLLQQVDSGDFNVVSYLADKEAETGQSVSEILTPEQLQKMQRAARYQYRKGLNPLIIAKKTKDEFLPMLRDTAVALGYDIPASLLGLAWSAANGDTDQFKKNLTEMHAAIETGGMNTAELLRKGARKVSDKAQGGVEFRDDDELNQRFFTDISMATQLRRIAQGKGENTVGYTEDLESRGVQLDTERIGRVGGIADPSILLPGGIAAGAVRKLATASPIAGRLAGVAGAGAALAERGVAKTAGAVVKAPGAVVEGVGKRISAAGTGTGGFATGAGIAGSIATGNLGPLVAGIVAPPVLRAGGDLLQWVGRGIKSKAPLAERATQLVTSTVVRPATEGAALGIIGAIPLAALTDNDDDAAMILAGSGAFEAVRRTGVAGARRGGQKLGGKMAEIAQAGQHLDASFVPYGDPTIDGPAQAVLERLAKSRPSDAALINNFRNALRGILTPDSEGKFQPVEIVPLGDADFAKIAQQHGGKGDEPGFTLPTKNAAGKDVIRIYLRESDGAKAIFHEPGHIVTQLMELWGLGDAWNGLVDKTFSGDKQAAAHRLYEHLFGQPISQARGRAELNAAIFSNILRGNPLDGLPKDFSQKAADMVGYVLERSGLYSPEIRAQKAAQITPARPLPGGFDPMGVQHSFVLDRAGRDLLSALRKGITSEAQVSAAAGQPPVARTGQPIPLPKAPKAPIPTAPPLKGEKGAPPVADLLATTTEAEWQQARQWLEESGASADTLRLFDQLRDAQGKEVEIVYQRITPESRIAETLNKARRETREAGYIKEALGALPEDLREEFFYRLVPYRTVVRWKNGKLNLNPLAFDLGVVFSNALLAVQDVFRINEGLRKTNKPEIVLPIGTEDFKTSTGENIRIISEAGARELRDKLRAYTQNQQHGYAGDGSRPLTVPEGYQERVPAVDPSYTPQVIGADWGNFINMLMGFEPPKTTRAGTPRLNIRGLPIKGTVNEAAQIFAAANSRSVLPSVTSKPQVFSSGKTIGDMNPLRVEIERAARQTIDPNYAMRDKLAEAAREFNLENIQEFIGTKDTGQKAAVEPFVQAGFMARQGDVTVEKVARDYAAERGFDLTIAKNPPPLNRDLLRRVADFYESAEHTPNAPEVKASYDAFKQETLDQWNVLEKAGYVMEPWTKEGQPYPARPAAGGSSGGEMRRDVRENKHLWFFRTEKGFGAGGKPVEHPLLEPTGIVKNGVPLLHNDIFRAVHDVMGHSITGTSFGPRGEFAAWNNHSELYSPLALPAMSAETLGQNSWVNAGPHLRRGEKLLTPGEDGFTRRTDRPYAEQKATLLPEELIEEAKQAATPQAALVQPLVEAVTALKESLRPEAPKADFMARTDAGREAQKRGIEFRDEQIGENIISIRAFQNDKAIGGILAVVREPNRAEVSLVGVEPEAQRTGLGETLYRELASELQRRGVTELTGDAVHPSVIGIRERVFPGTRFTDYRDVISPARARETIRVQRERGRGDRGVRVISKIPPDAKFMAARKPEKRLELTSKMWIEPTGAVVPLGGLGHEQWLSKESTRLNKKYGTKFTNVDDPNDRLRALAKGFTRISYETNSGRLAVETTQRMWTKSLRDRIFELAADNIEKIDNMAVNLFNEKGEIVKQDSAQLFMYDDAEKLDHLPMVTETRSRGAFMASVEGYVGRLELETGAIQARKGALDKNTHSQLYASAGTDWRYNPENKTVYWWDGAPESKQRAVVDAWLQNKGENPRYHTALINPDFTIEKTRRLFNEAHGISNATQKSKFLRLANKAHGIPNADFMADVRGYVGTTNASGAVRAESVLLSGKTTHESLGLRGKNNWRYNPKTQEVYWWELPSEESGLRESVDLWLERKGETPARHLPMFKNFRLAHDDPTEMFMAQPQTELGLDVPERPRYSRAEIGTMNQREKRERFPEAAIPRSAEQKVDYGILDSPRYKEAETEREAVTSFAGQLTSKYRQHKDTYAAKLGMRWYDDFLPMLKERYGDDAQVFAELLAATSPRNNPASNYTFAQRAFDKWKAGDYDSIIAKFNEGMDKLSDGQLLKEIEKAEPKLKEGDESFTPAKQLRWWIDKHDLLPKGDFDPETGKAPLYGMNSRAVLKVLARRWLQDNQGLKTNEFVRNLTGEDFGATIDMWAARTMREAGYAEYETRYRILPENETGVTDADFLFSQKVFKEAGRRLKLNPAQLQGALWFIEQMNWGDKGWADLPAYRSFVTEARKAGVREENKRLGTPTQEALFMGRAPTDMTAKERRAEAKKLIETAKRYEQDKGLGLLKFARDMRMEADMHIRIAEELEEQKRLPIRPE